MPRPWYYTHKEGEAKSSISTVKTRRLKTKVKIDQFRGRRKKFGPRTAMKQLWNTQMAYQIKFQNREQLQGNSL